MNRTLMVGLLLSLALAACGKPNTTNTTESCISGGAPTVAGNATRGKTLFQSTSGNVGCSQGTTCHAGDTYVGIGKYNRSISVALASSGKMAPVYCSTVPNPNITTTDTQDMAAYLNTISTGYTY